MGKASRQQSARERMRDERKRQEARERLMRRLLIGGSTVLVIALVVGIGVFVQTQRANGDGDYAGNLAPVKQLADGGIQMAQPGVDKPVLEVYEDFQCPICKQFEERSGATIKRLAAEGKVKVIYRTVSFVRMSQQDTRTIRANNAAMCAADQGKFMPYHDKLFAEQPPETPVQGFTDEDLKAWGRDVGISGKNYDEFTKCVDSQQHKDEVLKRTQQAQQEIQGTPTVFLNGRQLSGSIMSPDALEDEILSAGK